MIAIDIETCRIESMIERLPEPNVAVGNIKDPDKIAAKVAEAKAEQVAKMALSPMTGKVCSVAWYGEESFGAICDENELVVLMEAFGLLARNNSKSPVICTWNGLSFDLPFLYKRAMLRGFDLGTVPPLSYFSKRYSVSPHADLMQIWCGWFGYEKLENVAMALIGAGKTEIDVTMFHETIKTPEGRSLVAAYNLGDARLTYQIYERFNKVLI
jgi:DNA polymerase elongation subunit (family B)